MIIGSTGDFGMLSEALTYYRQKQGLSQYAVAKIMEVPHTTVRDLERRGAFSLDMLVRYVNALGVELEVNLRGKGAPG